MKIGLTYDLRSDYLEMGFTEEETAEFDSNETIDALEGTLKGPGHEVVRIGNIYELVRRLAANERWDLVFNICEGLCLRNREAQVPALLEAYNIPYTFSDPLTLSLCLDKAMAKRVVRDAGISTPEFFTVTSGKDLQAETIGKNMVFPVFVKPVAEGTGKGVTFSSIVHDKNELEKQCIKLLSKYNQPVLVERYLHGREFTVGILGTDETARVIGVMEVKLLKNAEPAVYSFMNKELCEDRIKYTLLKEKNLADEASDISLKAYKVLGCRDAGRVDLRADEEGKIYFLEMNPLAGLHPTHSDLPILCGKAGVTYRELISEIINSALERIRKAESTRACSEQAVFASQPLFPHMKVAIIYNEPAAGRPDSEDVLDEVELVINALGSLGYDYKTFSLDTRDSSYPSNEELCLLLNQLNQYSPSVIFNLIESIGESQRFHPVPASLFELSGYPCTGSPFEAILTTTDKALAKAVLTGYGIPTPLWDEYRGNNHINQLSDVKKKTAHSVFQGLDFHISVPPPWIIKPAWEDASVGIDDGSVISDEGLLVPKLSKMYSRYNGQTILIEEYIDGREFNISLFERSNGRIEVLPIAEMTFNNWYVEKPKIINYKAKWDKDSFEYKNTVRRFNPEDAPLDLLKELALKCWSVFGLRGYARVDMRMNKKGKLFVIEVNANPCIAPDSGFIAAAKEAGYGVHEVIKEILDTAERKMS